MGLLNFKNKWGQFKIKIKYGQREVKLNQTDLLNKLCIKRFLGVLVTNEKN